MICKNCDKEIIRESPKANNKKFCSVYCRNKYHYVNYRKKWHEDNRRKLKLKPSPNKLQCPICNEWHIQLMSHTLQKHNLGAREFKEKYGLDVKKGFVPKWYSRKKAEITLENKTYQNLEAGEKFRFKKGDKVGNYKRSEQTMERLREQGRKIAEKYGFKKKV